MNLNAIPVHDIAAYELIAMLLEERKSIIRGIYRNIAIGIFLKCPKKGLSHPFSY